MTVDSDSSDPIPSSPDPTDPMATTTQLANHASAVYSTENSTQDSTSQGDQDIQTHSEIETSLSAETVKVGTESSGIQNSEPSTIDPKTESTRHAEGFASSILSGHINSDIEMSTLGVGTRVNTTTPLHESPGTSDPQRTKSEDLATSTTALRPGGGNEAENSSASGARSKFDIVTAGSMDSASSTGGRGSIAVAAAVGSDSLLMDCFKRVVVCGLVVLYFGS